VNTEYLVVGAGLTGAVIARLLTDAGRRVLVVERRQRVAGNCADDTHPSGIRYHLYGPHYFRTNSHDIWNFVNRFGEFQPFRAQVKSLVQGKYENWPIAGSYLRAVAPDFVPSKSGSGPAANFEEAALRIMPTVVYELFVKEYNEKQWGCPATLLTPDLCKRFAIHEDDNPYLKPKHRFQGIPKNGYTKLVEHILQGIPVITNCDFFKYRNNFVWTRYLIYTGPVDEYFEYSLGRLQYRGQRRNVQYYPDVEGFILPVVQVNYPLHAQGPQIRRIEWKWLMEPKYAERIRGSLITEEIPFSPESPEEYEYPAQDFANRELYTKYKNLCDQERGVLICGRLGEYRYYDMDQAIARAQLLARRVLNED